jgi:hypothetical protein
MEAASGASLELMAKPDWQDRLAISSQCKTALLTLVLRKLRSGGTMFKAPENR